MGAENNARTYTNEWGDLTGAALGAAWNRRLNHDPKAPEEGNATRGQRRALVI